MKVQEIAYHRNGVCGEPFYVVTFKDDGREMVAVLFDFDAEEPEPVGFYNPRTAVFDREALGAGVIAFGENSHRGDRYNDALRRAIRDHEAGIRPGVESDAENARKWQNITTAERLARVRATAGGNR